MSDCSCRQLACSRSAQRPVTDPTEGRRRPRQRRSRDTVDVILEATARVLTEQGYANASTNRIAQRAGVSVGSIYQYFGGKDALIVALAERHTLEMIDAVGQLLQELSDAPLEQVVHQVLMTQCPDVVELPSVKALEEGFLSLLRGIMVERSDQRREDLDHELAAWLLTRAGEVGAGVRNLLLIEGIFRYKAVISDI